MIRWVLVVTTQIILVDVVRWWWWGRARVARARPLRTVVDRKTRRYYQLQYRNQNQYRNQLQNQIHQIHHLRHRHPYPSILCITEAASKSVGVKCAVRKSFGQMRNACEMKDTYRRRDSIGRQRKELQKCRQPPPPSSRWRRNAINFETFTCVRKRAMRWNKRRSGGCEEQLNTETSVKWNVRMRKRSWSGIAHGDDKISWCIHRKGGDCCEKKPCEAVEDVTSYSDGEEEKRMFCEDPDQDCVLSCKSGWKLPSKLEGNESAGDHCVVAFWACHLLQTTLEHRYVEWRDQ